MKKIAILAITAFMIAGCGSENSGIDKNSKTYFGILSNATVNIYELGREKKLISSQTTTTGNTVDAIGNIDTRTITFDPIKFYQYEVTGGENWDIDKDGVKDKISTPNNLIYRAIYKGSKSHVAWWGIEMKNSRKKVSK